GNEIPPTLPLPPNLYIIGTVNIDETTYMFSPKVLDRAFTLEFREVNFSTYPPGQTGENWTTERAEEIRKAILKDLRNGGKFCGAIADKDKVKKALQALGNKKAELEELNGILQPYDLHFGYRVLDEIALFVQNAINAPDVVGSLNDDEALDHAVLMKVLPKFHGPRQRLERPLREVLRWAAKDDAPKWVKETNEAVNLETIAEALRNWKAHFRYPNTAKKVLQMLRQLYETGFASFAQ
ncbi:MAG: hypothetical protein NOOUEUKL_001970, partial [Candidatus Fervidibacter sp.]